MILSICARQNTEYDFSVWNTVSTQSYVNAGIDILNDVTAATLSFNKVNGDAADAVTVDIIAYWQYLFTDGGLTINFADFGLTEIFDLDYFADWMWEVEITYTYLGTDYTASITVGFLKIIKNIVYQQLMKSNWRKELSCNCGCDPYNSTLRKWDYLQNLQMAAELCLVAEWERLLLALYKLTGTDHPFDV